MYAKNLFISACLLPFIFAPAAALAAPRAMEVPEKEGTSTAAATSAPKTTPKSMRGERVMQPEYGPPSPEVTHTVQQKGGKVDPKPEPAAADMYLKIGDIKGESED